jgi:hypothetical protein
MVNSKRPSVLTATIVVLSLIAVAAHGSRAIGQPADSNPYAPPIQAQTVPAKPRPENTAQIREMGRAAYEAYERSLADYQTGKITDPEVVYRWSIRTMQAEDAIHQDVVRRAKNHSRRMMQLADLALERSATEGGDKSLVELQRLATNYYRQEAQLLLEQAMAGSGDVVSFTPSLTPTRASADDTALSSLSRRKSTTAKKEAAPQQTKVYVLAHAPAQEVSQMIKELLDVRSTELRMAVDARTNRVFVNGAAGKIAEVDDLIQQLDVPGKHGTLDGGGGSDLTAPQLRPGS